MRRSTRGQVQLWWRRLQCAHHWHPAGFIDWDCCWCEKNVDGWPKDQSRACHREIDVVRAILDGTIQVT